MIAVGMDVNVRNSYVHATDAAGQVLWRGRCRNTLMDLADFCGPLEQEARKRNEPVRAVPENTTSDRPVLARHPAGARRALHMTAIPRTREGRAGG